MRRLFFILLIAPCFTAHVWANSDLEETLEKSRTKMSGQVIFMSSTNSSLSGGYFNDKPAIRGLITASKGGFSFTGGRNSDLIEPKSAANVCIFIPSYTMTFGNFSANFATEVHFFDQRIDLDIIAPATTLTLRGAVTFELFFIYGWAFQHKDYADIFTQRLAISRDYAGFTFKLTGWNVYLGTHRNAVAFEVSTKLTEKMRLSVSANLNHNYGTDVTQKYGVVRLAYLF